jgi:hypothetical protein
MIWWLRRGLSRDGLPSGDGPAAWLREGEDWQLEAAGPDQRALKGARSAGEYMRSR